MPPYFIGILLVLSISLSGCFIPKTIKQEQQFFEKNIAGNTRISQHLLMLDGDLVFYAAAGNSQKPTLIIIHGTPGDWQQYARFLLNDSLLQHFYIVVIDRPGWGQSRLGGGRQVATFREQARLISALAEQFKAQNHRQPVILMGHSLGASLAPRVAMDFPESVDGLLLLAGTLDPALSRPRWFNYVADWPVFNFLIGNMLRKSNEEIMILESEMLAMASYWQDVDVQTIVVQGMKDQLVYPHNIEFAENQLNANVTETIRLEQDGHLFPMTRRDDIAFWATCLLQRLERPSLYCQKNGVAIDDTERKN